MSQRFAPHLVAACLILAACPLAAADSPAASKDGPFRVELPDGASVELVGVGENAAGDRGWWRPDGSPLPIAPGGGGAPELAAVGNSIVRTFAVTIVTDGKAQMRGPGPKKPAVEWYAQMETVMKERLGAQFLEKRRTVAAMAPNSRTSMVVQYAGGPWKTLTTAKRQGIGVFVGVEHGVGLGVVWDTASDENGAARIAAAYHVDEPLVRIVAVDEQNQEHESEPRPGGVANDVRLESARFPGLPIARVKEFRFQTRPFNHEIEFRHVSLHAGQKSPVQMYLDGFRYLPKTTGVNARVDSPKPVSAGETKRPQPATDAEVLKRIFANWRARQDRIQSFRCEWNTREVTHFRKRTFVTNLRRALWVAGENRFRFERSLVGKDERSRWDFRARDIRACDGSTSFVLEWLRGLSDPPLGAVGGENEIREFDHLECDPLYLAFRPCHPLLGSKDAPLKIVKRNAIVDGIPCLELTRRVGESIQSCWVDPSRDDLVVQSERRHPRLGLWRVTITHRFSPQVGWIPDRWTLHRPWSDDDKVLCEATTCILNERLPADVFRIDFPPGTLVFDLKTRKQSVIAADGSQIAAPSFESVSSPAFRKALDAVEPFTIAPEPIQDALDFLRQYHKLPINWDRPAFRRTGLRIETECQCDIEGLTMREQVRWFSAALPKPIRLVEKDGELLLTPASSSKPEAPRNQANAETK